MLYNIIVRKTKLICLGGMYNMKVYVVKEVYDLTEMPNNLRVFKTKEAAEKWIESICIRPNSGYDRYDFEIEELPFNEE